MTNFDGEPVPYRLSFQDDILPVDVAWLQIAVLSKEEFNTMAGRVVLDDSKPESVGLSLTGLADKEAAALISHHENQGKYGIGQFATDMRNNLIRSGASEEQATHLINVFCLGILVGRRECEISEQYARQGIADIEAGAD